MTCLSVKKKEGEKDRRKQECDIPSIDTAAGHHVCWCGFEKLIHRHVSVSIVNGKGKKGNERTWES